MNWLYNGKEITDISQFPSDTFGFIYEVITPEGKKYVGKKVLYHNQKKKLTKIELSEQTGRGRRKTFKIVQKESDWKKYYGSNKHLKNQITKGEVTLEDLGKQIIQTASNKKQLTYLETKYLFQLEVLENPDLYYNDNILGKFFTSDFDY
tara:strand:- start:683 stop:1132 length:450 start_codon:yes stop_codon:yes gene_type:complete